MMPDPVDIMVVAETDKDGVHPEIYALIAFGRRLQSLGAGAMGIWLIGGDVAGAAEEIAACSGIPVTAVQCAGWPGYVCEAYAALLGAEISMVKPSFVCVAHTSRGWEWAPGTAARIGAGCICGVDDVSASRGRICFQKDIYGGKVKGFFASHTATTLITVLPGSSAFTPSTNSPPGAVTLKASSWSPENVRHGGTRPSGTDAADITTAPIVVAVGNGIGGRENMPMIHRLAALLPKAAVAGTRIVCDRGWLGYDRQVGVTGASVTPALYVACGISGASQHVTGMRGAKFVIAINTDPCAPIFNQADICVVEDITRFLPLLEAACARLAKSKIGSTTIKGGET